MVQAVTALTDRDVTAMVREAYNEASPELLARHIYSLALERKRLATWIADLSQQNGAYTKLADSAKRILQRDIGKPGVLNFLKTKKQGLAEAAQTEVAALIQQVQDLIAAGGQLQRQADLNRHDAERARGLDAVIDQARNQITAFEREVRASRGVQQQNIELSQSLAKAQQREQQLMVEIETLKQSQVLLGSAPETVTTSHSLLETQQQLSNAQTEISALQEQLAASRGPVSSAEPSGPAERTFQIRFNEAMAKQIELEGKLITSDGLREEAQEEVRKISAQLLESQSSVSRLENAVSELEADRNIATEELQNAKAEALALGQQIADEASSHSKTRTELTTSQDRLNQANDRVAELNGQLGSLQLQFDSAAEELKTALDANQTLQDSFSKAQQELQQMRDKQSEHALQIDSLIEQQDLLIANIAESERTHQQQLDIGAAELRSTKHELHNTRQSLESAKSENLRLGDRHDKLMTTINSQSVALRSVGMSKHHYYREAQKMAMELRENSQLLAQREAQIASLQQRLEEAVSMQRVVPFRRDEAQQVPAAAQHLEPQYQAESPQP